MNNLSFHQLQNFQTGDRLIRRKGLLTWHHGIFADTASGPLVAENQAVRGVQYVPLHTFLADAGGSGIQIKKFEGTEVDRAQIIPRINALLGQPYNLVNFNCEHFAELIQNHRSESQQVAAIVLGIAAVGLGYLAFGGRGRK